MIPKMPTHKQFNLHWEIHVKLITGKRIVKQLETNYTGSGRNISMDNFFTFLPLVKHLLGI